jgi:hypothetical protein
MFPFQLVEIIFTSLGVAKDSTHHGQTAAVWNSKNEWFHHDEIIHLNVSQNGHSNRAGVGMRMPFKAKKFRFQSCRMLLSKVPR